MLNGRLLCTAGEGLGAWRIGDIAGTTLSPLFRVHPAPAQPILLPQAVARIVTVFAGRVRMKITFGKHRGKTLELVALKDPEFIRDLLLSESSTGTRERLRAEAERLVTTFNRRAFVVHCVGNGCNRQATRCTLYKSGVNSPWWWCDECDPWQYGAGQLQIQIVRTYQDVLDFSDSIGDTTTAQDLVMALAEAKGLILWSRLSELKADLFFNG